MNNNEQANETWHYEHMIVVDNAKKLIRRKPHHTLVDAIRRKIGEFAWSLLKNCDPGKVLLSGSVLLDAYHGTCYAKDVDFFCVPDSYEKIRTMFTEQLGEGIFCREGGNYVEFADEMTIYYPLDALASSIPWSRLDLIKCGDPARAITLFDSIINMVAFDGKYIWQHPEWSPSLNEPYLVLTNGEYLKRALQLIGTYGSGEKRSVIRLLKLAIRGYNIKTIDGLVIRDLVGGQKDTLIAALRLAERKSR